MPHQFTRSCLVAILLAVTLPDSKAKEPTNEHPLSAAERKSLRERFRRTLDETPPPNASTPDSVSAHSRRGDALFFLAEYKQAVLEYQAMVRLDPKLDASHWRLGIALYFAGQPKGAAEQFDKYQSFDDVDRENGIWRYLCHHRAFGADRAAKELLRYAKDDREPFPIVYRLFDGSITPEEALKRIPETLPAIERDKQLFYTELYIGMLKTVQGDTAVAQMTLHSATSRKWPRTAGFGPSYMWHVARLQWNELAAKNAKTDHP
jgi:lipoprotein NlpI